MVNITLSINEELKQKMEQFPEINWSGLVRKIIEEEIKKRLWKEEMLKKLESEKDFTAWTVELGRKVKKDIVKRLKKEGHLKDETHR